MFPPRQKVRGEGASPRGGEEARGGGGRVEPTRHATQAARDGTRGLVSGLHRRPSPNGARESAETSPPPRTERNPRWGAGVSPPRAGAEPRHISMRRGHRSTRRVPADDDEGGFPPVTMAEASPPHPSRAEHSKETLPPSSWSRLPHTPAPGLGYLPGKWALSLGNGRSPWGGSPPAWGERPRSPQPRRCGRPDSLPSWGGGRASGGGHLL